MPVLGYFTVVGGLLLGLLFVADGYMPRKEHLSFASNVDGLPAAYKGEPRVAAAAPHVTPTPAIAETTGSSGAPALASEAPRRAPAAAPAPVVHEAAKPAKPRKMVRRRHEFQDERFGSFGRQDYARQEYARQDYGFGREPSREPSWRDSWASGSFQQPRESRGRRSAWRSGNDFGGFGNFGSFR